MILIDVDQLELGTLELVGRGLFQASEKGPQVPSEHRALAHGVCGMCLAQTCSASWLQACEENGCNKVRVGL